MDVRARPRKPSWNSLVIYNGGILCTFPLKEIKIMWIQTSKGRLFISERMRGKMKGIMSISTSCTVNPFCQHMQNRENWKCEKVCASCYAQRMQSYQKHAKDAYVENYKTLNAGLLTDEDCIKLKDVFYTRYGRIEAFGEVGTEIQAQNYVKIIKANPNCQFGIWTKRPNLWAWAFKQEGGKSENCNLVVSSPNVGEVRKLITYKDITDTLFTVYRKEQADEQGIEINCGSRNCIECQKCYRKHSELEYVNELLK